jgi:hypothetical protein
MSRYNILHPSSQTQEALKMEKAYSSETPLFHPDDYKITQREKYLSL